MTLVKNNQNSKNDLRYDPWKSPSLLKLYDAYKQQSNTGAFRELKEEIKTILWIDCLDFLRRSGSALEFFKMTETLHKWLAEDPIFHGAEKFIGCFFTRKDVIPYPERQRNHRKYPNLQRPRTKKKYSKLFYRQALKNLRKILFIAKMYNRKTDEQQLRDMRLAFCVIFHMVRIFYVESMSSKKLSPQEYDRLLRVAPVADGMYSRQTNGFYTTKEKYSFGRALGWKAAEEMLMMYLEKFSSRMRREHH